MVIYNGESPLSPLISHHCGNIVPADIITQSNHVTLRFHSDGSVEKSGFQLKITQVSSGSILKGNYKLSIIYYKLVTTDEWLKFSFNDFLFL